MCKKYTPVIRQEIEILLSYNIDFLLKFFYKLLLHDGNYTIYMFDFLTLVFNFIRHEKNTMCFCSQVKVNHYE